MRDLHRQHYNVYLTQKKYFFKKLFLTKQISVSQSLRKKPVSLRQITTSCVRVLSTSMFVCVWGEGIFHFLWYEHYANDHLNVIHTF